MSATEAEAEVTDTLNGDVLHGFCTEQYPPGTWRSREFMESVCGAVVLVATIPEASYPGEVPPEACPKCMATWPICPKCGREC